MLRLLSQAVIASLLGIALLPCCPKVPCGQGPSPLPNVCSAWTGRSADLTATENLVRAEIFDAAECSARQLTAAHPESADAHFLLGYILNRKNQPDESLKEYTAGSKYRHPSPNNLAIVALDYALLRDYSDAAKWMTHAIDSEPGNAQYWYYLGRIQYNANVFSAARDAFAKALSLSSSHDLRDLYNLGLAYEGLGNTEKAAALYRQAITQEGAGTSHDAQPFYDLASLLLRQNQPQDALPLLEKAASLDPRNPGIYERLAKAEEQTGQLDRSREALEMAISLSPNVSSLHFELGHVYQKLHMATDAKEQFGICSRMAGTYSSTGSANPDFARP